MRNKLSWVNTQMDQETKEKLESMADTDARSRSNMIRWLILNEWDKRNDVKVPQKQDTAI